MARIPIAVAALLAATYALLPMSALSAEWKPSLAITGAATLSDNARLSQGGRKEADMILSVTPTVGISKDGGRLKVNGRYSPSLFTYVAGTGDTTVRNTLNGTARLEAIESFFFVDARASILQTFLNPFDAQPGDLSTTSSNRTESTNLGISPYIRGRLSGGSQYQVRADTSYTTISSSDRPDILGNSVLSTWTGTADRFLVPSVDYNYYSTRYGSQSPFVAQIGRGRLAANVDTDFQVFVTGGYENNDFVFSQQQGAIYGGGFNWRPSPRTSIRASSEHRFFGNSIDIDASYRTQLTAWALNAGRRAQTSQQQYQQLGVSNVRTTLDTLLSPTIPDPIEREREIDRILSQPGLAASLSGPVPLYSPRILLVESIDPSFAILGSRSTIALRLFWRRTTPLSDAVVAGTADAFANLNAVTQRGLSLTGSHKLAPILTLDATASRTWSHGSTSAPGNSAFESTQTLFRIGLTQQLTPSTFGTAGVRWQAFESNSATNYQERAVLVSVSHIFF